MKEVMIYNFDQDGIQIAGTWVYSVSTLDRFNGILVSGGTNSENIKYSRYFPKSGVYKIRIIYRKGANEGKLDIGMDSSTTDIVSALDLYNASQTENNVYEMTKNISRGYHTIAFLANGKNASSSNYYIAVQALEFDLIQESSQYQEDAPAQINQGSVVLLAKHKAEVAESTFTFNLADVGTKYDEVLVKINGGATASLALQAAFNGNGTNYLQKGYSSIAGSVAAINITTGSILRLASTSILTGATDFESWFTLKKNASTNWNMGQWGSTGFSVGNESGSWNHDTAASANITSIVISTSTSTWKAGTIIEIWGFKHS